MDAIVFDVMIDAVEDTNVIMIPSEVLSSLMEKYPKIEAYLYRTATERFSDVIWTMQRIFFLAMFGNMVFQTYLVAAGAASLKEAIKLFWTFRVPWGWTYSEGFV